MSPHQVIKTADISRKLIPDFKDIFWNRNNSNKHWKKIMKVIKPTVVAELEECY